MRSGRGVDVEAPGAFVNAVLAPHVSLIMFQLPSSDDMAGSAVPRSLPRTCESTVQGPGQYPRPVETGIVGRHVDPTSVEGEADTSAVVAGVKGVGRTPLVAEGPAK